MTRADYERAISDLFEKRTEAAVAACEVAAMLTATLDGALHRPETKALVKKLNAKLAVLDDIERVSWKLIQWFSTPVVYKPHPDAMWRSTMTTPAETNPAEEAIAATKAVKTNEERIARLELALGHLHAALKEAGDDDCAATLESYAIDAEPSST
jgi:hypothetical protein